MTDKSKQQLGTPEQTTPEEPKAPADTGWVGMQQQQQQQRQQEEQ
jgi:hypothetical protein